MNTNHLSTVESLQALARRQMAQGAITEAYGADRTRVISVLNAVLATEIVCVLRYKRHHYTAAGRNASAAAAEFAQHASDEQGHADSVAARIVQLRGEPDFNPATLLERSHAAYAPGTDLLDMVREDLVAERVAVASYQEIVRWLGEGDPTTRRLIESILEVEEEHAEDMLTLLTELGGEPDPASEPTSGSTNERQPSAKSGIDEAIDESFPASDAPATWSGTDDQAAGG